MTAIFRAALTTRTRGLDVCRRFGADELINYESDDLRAQLARVSDQGVDVALDPVGGAHSERVVRSMAWGGRYLVVGFSSGEIPKRPLNLPLLKGCAILGVAWDSYSRRDQQQARANIAQLSAWIAEGKLQPAVTAEYPLDRAALALDHVMQRKVQGKVVVVP